MADRVVYHRMSRRKQRQAAAEADPPPPKLSAAHRSAAMERLYTNHIEEKRAAKQAEEAKAAKEKRRKRRKRPKQLSEAAEERLYDNAKALAARRRRDREAAERERQAAAALQQAKAHQPWKTVDELQANIRKMQVRDHLKHHWSVERYRSLAAAESNDAHLCPCFPSGTSLPVVSAHQTKGVSAAALRSR